MLFPVSQFKLTITYVTIITYIPNIMYLFFLLLYLPKYKSFIFVSLMLGLFWHKIPCFVFRGEIPTKTFFQIGRRTTLEKTSTHLSIFRMDVWIVPMNHTFLMKCATISLQLMHHALSLVHKIMLILVLCELLQSITDLCSLIYTICGDR